MRKNYVVTVKNVDNNLNMNIVLPTEEINIHLFLDGLGIISCGDEYEVINWGGIPMITTEETSLFEANDFVERLLA